MFGAAGAPVTAPALFAPDLRFEPMSTAAVLLSMIAPAAPATSQGSADIDASAFEGLLATAMGGDLTGEEQGDDALPSGTTADADAAVAATTPVQTTVAATPVAPLILGNGVSIDLDAAAEAAPATQAPVVETGDDAAPVETAPLTQPAAPDQADDEKAADVADATPLVLPALVPAPTVKATDAGPQVRPALDGKSDQGPEVLPPAPTEKPVLADGPQTQPPAPVPASRRFQSGGASEARAAEDATLAVPSLDAAPTPQPLTQPTATTDVAKVAPQPIAPRPQVQPAEAKAAPLKADGGDAAETPDLAPALDAPVPGAERKEATAQGPDVQLPLPQLRQLASRAETNAAVDTAAPAAPQGQGQGQARTPAAAAPVATTGAEAAAVAKPAEVADNRAEAAASSDAPADQPVDAASLDAAPSAQTAHAARDAAATPTLSRATVEATAQIAAQILKRLDGRSTRFEMALMPDDLGRVDVKLDIDAEGRLAARLAFDNPAAATDLKGRADELRRQLEQQGFHLADDAFEFTERDSGSSAFDRGQGSSGQERGQSRAFAAASRLNAETDIAARPARWTALSLAPAGVDLKV